MNSKEKQPEKPQPPMPGAPGPAAGRPRRVPTALIVWNTSY